MTARRAITELVNEGILVRSQGLGTFVSDHRPMSSMLEIRSIHDEIRNAVILIKAKFCIWNLFCNRTAGCLAWCGCGREHFP